LLQVVVHDSEPPAPNVQATVPQAVELTDPGKELFPVGQRVHAAGELDDQLGLYLPDSQSVHDVTSPLGEYLPYVQP
jgi:hypothetical protein